LRSFTRSSKIQKDPLGKKAKIIGEVANKVGKPGELVIK